jgi:hypothetical protein
MRSTKAVMPPIVIRRLVDHLFFGMTLSTIKNLNLFFGF